MAKANNTEKRVEELVMPIIEKNNFELVDVEFVKEGQNWFLRLYVDKPGGILIDDCELVSREVEKLLDESDPIEQAYILEVSSPGLDRPLKKDKDFERYKGEIIDIKLYKPVNGKKAYEGELVGLIDGKIVIKDENDDFSDVSIKEVNVFEYGIVDLEDIEIE